jgi:hypothetical protein
MTTETSPAAFRFRPAIAKATGPLAIKNIRDIQDLFAHQVRTGNRRLLASLEEVFAEPHPASASRTCALYLAESAQASARNMFDWNRLLVRVCSKTMTSVLETTPAVAETADA